MSIYKRTCRTCGASFDGGPRAWYCPRCRADRIKKSQAECKARKKAGNGRTLGEIYPCEICGEDYILKGSNQRFCEECAKKHLKEVDNQQSRAWNAKHKNEMQRHKQAEQERYKKIAESVQYYTANPKKLTQLREDKGLSKHRLSVLSSVNAKTISHLESLDSYSDVRLSTLEKIASALQMSPEEFFKELYK